MPDPKVILLEFNELTPSLLDRFMEQGMIPNFKRFHDEALIYVTDAEESGERLNPWIQWVTVHTGLSYDEHGVFHLNEGHKLTKPCVWDLLSARGFRVWVCGSMNVRYDVPLNGYVLPDPWTVNVEPYPPEAGLKAYYRFVQTQVQEHTNERVPLTRADYVRFLKFMVSHGLSAQTTSAIVKQLAKERLGDGKWKRAAILDKLQFDVFRSVYRKLRPHFSTFFLNSTAHMQHAYWRHMDPEPFRVKPSEEDRSEYGEAVLFGYREMDRILGRFLDLAGSDATLVFCSGLSQQPCLVYEETGGKRFYRPKDFEKLLAFAGITAPHKCSPVMSEQFHVYLTSEQDAEIAERRLRALQVNGRPLMRVEREELNAVFAGAGIFDALPEDAVLTAEGGASARFFDLFYQADTLKSGMHHPDGALWIRTPARRHRVIEERVSLRAVAPTVLAMFGVEPPAFMRAEALELEAERVLT
jgi:hypothetical protein